MKSYIKILQRKTVLSEGKEIETAKIVDIAPAEINDDTKEATVLAGVYAGKVISPLNQDYKSHDYIYQKVDQNVLSINMAQNPGALNLSRSLYNGTIFKVLECDDRPLLCGVNNDEYKDAYEDQVIPNNTLEESEGKSLVTEDIPSRSKQLRDYNISSIYEELKEVIFGLDDELKNLLATIINNYHLSQSTLSPHSINHLKSNILILGRSGTGKKWMVTNIANILGIPYTIEDISTYSTNHFENNSLDNILVNLYRASGYDITKMEHGIIFIDRIDKLCKKDEKDHTNSIALQDALLRMIKGTKITKKVFNGTSAEEITFDTSKITFIVAGTFQNIFRRSPELNKSEFLTRQGIEKELLNQLSSTIITSNPKSSNLYKALISPKHGYLTNFKEYLEINGINLEINESVLRMLASRTLPDNGYHMIPYALNELVQEYLYEIIEGKTNTIKIEKTIRQHPSNSN